MLNMLYFTKTSSPACVSQHHYAVKCNLLHDHFDVLRPSLIVCGLHTQANTRDTSIIAQVRNRTRSGIIDFPEFAYS
ncbi:hypothetical protein VNO77_32748 [Canavalia gladiata]|uniref:Uncharacterized protein n=1 Tax=Canavalia gladiata TaxID=3824 RepID=A0AAN9Q586_CANGL